MWWWGKDIFWNLSYPPPRNVRDIGNLVGQPLERHDPISLITLATAQIKQHTHLVK